jgi:hypothetical protein
MDAQIMSDANFACLPVKCLRGTRLNAELTLNALTGLHVNFNVALFKEFFNAY